MARVVRQLQLRVSTGTRVVSVGRAPDASPTSPLQVHDQPSLTLFNPCTSSQDSLLLQVVTEPAAPNGAHNGRNGGAAQTTYLSRSVVLAFGASSFQRALDVQPRALAASIISAKLGAPRLYTNRSVIVVGVGPSGLESAVRICNYGAAHVALLARGTSASNSRSSTTRGLRYVRGVASRLVRARQSRTHDCPPP